MTHRKHIWDITFTSVETSFDSSSLRNGRLVVLASRRTNIEQLLENDVTCLPIRFATFHCLIASFQARQCWRRGGGGKREQVLGMAFPNLKCEFTSVQAWLALGSWTSHLRWSQLADRAGALSGRTRNKLQAYLEDYNLLGCETVCL
jgi:hypothetical protein